MQVFGGDGEAVLSGNLDLFDREQGQGGEERSPTYEGQGDHERTDLGGAQLLLVMEELVHGGRTPRHRAGQSTGSL